jgi:hypothetical protein
MGLRNEVPEYEKGLEKASKKVLSIVKQTNPSGSEFLDIPTSYFCIKNTLNGSN